MCDVLLTRLIHNWNLFDDKSKTWMTTRWLLTTSIQWNNTGSVCQLCRISQQSISSRVDFYLQIILLSTEHTSSSEVHFPSQNIITAWLLYTKPLQLSNYQTFSSAQWCLRLRSVVQLPVTLGIMTRKLYRLIDRERCLIPGRNIRLMKYYQISYQNAAG